jgi:ferredoxin-thioredoxin reductase catalytic chain
MKKFYRCFLCNDIHYGVGPPRICPTCRAENAYLGVSSDEAQKVMSPRKTRIDRRKFLREIEKLSESNDFRLNPDQEKVQSLIDGIIENESSHGMKYCPCRLITKDFEEDLLLVCPCNFRIHETYKGKPDGECWCGLFVKKEGADEAQRQEEVSR